MTRSIAQPQRSSGSPGRLPAAVGLWGFFALSFGSVVGSGWVVVLGDWLSSAGPAGVVVGFLVGALVMASIGLCYGRLAAGAAAAGGEFLYVMQALGRGPGFLVGWFIILYGIAICGFEAIVFAWLIRTVAPGESVVAYQIVGSAVTWDALLLGWSGALVVGVLHYRGASTAISFQNVATALFIALSVGLLIAAFGHGEVRNLEPLFIGDGGTAWIAGSIGVFSMCAFFLNGWQTALHAIEERMPGVTVSSAVWATVAGIGVAAFFYAAIVLAAASAAPWQSLTQAELPAVVAFASLTPSGIFGMVVLVAAIISLAKTWNALAWLASRILFAQAREGLLPPWFAKLGGERRTPRVAVVFVTIISMLLAALGRGAILPIVNMASTCLGLSILLCLAILVRRRETPGSQSEAFRIPGGRFTLVVASLGAIAMLGIAILKPLLESKSGLPIEWKLLGIWGALGAVAYRVAHRSRSPAVQSEPA